MYVYMIINGVNGKFYVGKTVRDNLKRYLDQNFIEAFSKWPEKRNGKPRLYNAMRKYGREAFSILPLVSSLKTNEELCLVERHLIALFKAQDRNVGYNISDGGDGATHSPETKLKMSQTHKMRARNGFSAEHRQRISDSKKGQSHPQTMETRLKIANSRLGKKYPRAVV